MAAIIGPRQVLNSASVSSHIARTRHDLLWMSLGLLLGLCILSLVVKGLDMLRGNQQGKLRDYQGEMRKLKRIIAKQKGHIDILEAELNQSRYTIRERDETINLYTAQVRRLLDDIVRLSPFETEANTLRPEIGTLKDEIRTHTRAIKTLQEEKACIANDLKKSQGRVAIVTQKAAEAADSTNDLKASLVGSAESMNRVRAEHQEAIAELKHAHLRSMTNLSDRHMGEMNRLQEEHRAGLDTRMEEMYRLQEEHRVDLETRMEEMDRLQEKHRADIETLLIHKNIEVDMARRGTISPAGSSGQNPPGELTGATRGEGGLGSGQQRGSNPLDTHKITELE